MVVTVEWVGAALALVGFAGCAVAIRGLSREVRAWRSAACGLSSVVRGIEAWPVVQVDAEAALRVANLRAEGMALVPIPPSVALVGRSAAVDRWSLQAADALMRFDALCEPHGGER